MKTSHLTVLSLTDQAIISATRFLIAVMIGRFGSEAELGLYSVGFGLLVVIVTCQESLLTTPFTFFVSKMEPQEAKLFAGSTLACVVTYALSIVPMIFIAIGVIAFLQVKASLLPVLFVLGVVTPIFLLREFSRRWLFAQLRISMATILDCIFASGALAGLFLLARLDQLTAVNAFWVSALGGLLVVITATVLFKSDFQFRPDRFKSDTRRNLSFGRWTAGASLLGAVSFYFAHWYLAFKLGEATAGIYAACLTIVLLANPFVLGITSFLAPRAALEYADRGQPGLSRLIYRFLAVMVGGLGLFALGMSQFGDLLMKVIFDESYRGYQATITTLSLGVIGQGINNAVASGLRAMNRPRLDWYGALIGLATMIVLTVLIGPSNVLEMAICSTASILAMATFRLTIFVHLCRFASAE